MVNQDFFGGTNPFNLQDLEGTDFGLRTIFEQARPDAARTTSQRNLFSSLYDRVLKDFQNQLGSEFKVGRLPSQTFTEFVEGQDFDNQFRREAANRRFDSRLSGPARFLFDL